MLLEKTEVIDEVMGSIDLIRILGNAFKDEIDLRNPIRFSQDLLELDWGEDTHLWTKQYMGNDVWDSFIVDNTDSLTRRKFSKVMQRNQKNSIISGDNIANLKYDEKINISVFGNPIVRQEDAEILGAVYASVK